MSFERYAAYYDALYQDKPYANECDYLEGLWRAHSKGLVRRVLDVGCGTGGHLLELTRRGYRVSGVDRSETMLKRLLLKAEGMRPKVYCGDLPTIKLNGPFDAAIAMFAVFGYITEDRDLERALRTIRGVLRQGGLFAFDVWNGLAVLNQGVEARTKEVRDGGLRIVRKATPQLEMERNVCLVHYGLLVYDGSRILDRFQELHAMRFFFPEEIVGLLERCGFSVEVLSPFMRPEEALTEKDWNMGVVARAR